MFGIFRDTENVAGGDTTQDDVTERCAAHVTSDAMLRHISAELYLFRDLKGVGSTNGIFLESVLSKGECSTHAKETCMPRLRGTVHICKALSVNQECGTLAVTTTNIVGGCLFRASILLD